LNTMKATQDIFHGTRVGITTAQICHLYSKYSDINDIKVSHKKYDIKMIIGIFKKNDLYKEFENEFNPNPLAEIDCGILREKWQEIKQILKELPTSIDVQNLLDLAGAPKTGKDVGFEQIFINKILENAKYIRRRITFAKLIELIDNKVI